MRAAGGPRPAAAPVCTSSRRAARATAGSSYPFVLRSCSYPPWVASGEPAGHAPARAGVAHAATAATAEHVSGFPVTAAASLSGPVTAWPLEAHEVEPRRGVEEHRSGTRSPPGDGAPSRRSFAHGDRRVKDSARPLEQDLTGAGHGKSGEGIDRPGRRERPGPLWIPWGDFQGSNSTTRSARP